MRKLSKDEDETIFSDGFESSNGFPPAIKKPVRENVFEVKCRNCGYAGDANDFIASTDVWMDSEDMTFVTHKEVTLKCPQCKSSESLDKSPLW